MTTSSGLHATAGLTVQRTLMRGAVNQLMHFRARIQSLGLERNMLCIATAIQSNYECM